MINNRNVVPLVIGLTFALTLSACGKDAEKPASAAKAQAKASAPATPQFDARKPASFSTTGNCASPDVVINSYPNMYLMIGDKACEIGASSRLVPGREFHLGKICIESDIITNTDYDAKATIMPQTGNTYSLTYSDNTPAETLTLCDNNYANAPVLWGALTEPNNKADFDFEQSYNKVCEDYSCYALPKFYQKFSDYNQAVLSNLNLTTDLQARKINSHLGKVYGGSKKRL